MFKSKLSSYEKILIFFGENVCFYINIFTFISHPLQPQDLQKKREDRKNEVKKVADEEIKFLQANGKIKKKPANFSTKKKSDRSVRGSVTSEVREDNTTSKHSDQEDESPRVSFGKNQTFCGNLKGVTCERLIGYLQFLRLIFRT